MKSKFLGCASAALLGAAIALSTPAMAFRGGFGGSGFGGGIHGGFGGGGMHGGFGGGSMHFGVASAGAWSPAGAVRPGGNRFAGAC